MKELIEQFGQQLSEALKIGKSYTFKNTANNEIQNVVISGLGGSGIGGSFVQNYSLYQIKVPIVVSKNYDIPAFVSKNTLFIACSYSGNTEETLNSYQQALVSGATIVSISSGGKLSELAATNGQDCIKVPGGNPPRSTLGLSFVQILFILKHYNLLNDQFISEIESAIKLIESEQPAIIDLAHSYAKKWAHKLPIIYIDNDMEAVAVRWRQQINENGKMLAWTNVIPEMNHNELVGWRDKNENLEVLFLKNESDNARVKVRMDINQSVIAQYAKVSEIHSKGASFLERAFYLIHIGDWISYFLAEERRFDVTEVKVIDHLKGELSKID